MDDRNLGIELKLLHRKEYVILCSREIRSLENIGQEKSPVLGDGQMEIAVSVRGHYPVVMVQLQDVLQQEEHLGKRIRSFKTGDRRNRLHAAVERKDEPCRIFLQTNPANLVGRGQFNGSGKQFTCSLWIEKGIRHQCDLGSHDREQHLVIGPGQLGRRLHLP